MNNYLCEIDICTNIQAYNEQQAYERFYEWLDMYEAYLGDPVEQNTSVREVCEVDFCYYNDKDLEENLIQTEKFADGLSANLSNTRQAVQAIRKEIKRRNNK